jgi:diguanylate cyclase (GGDEF)-like protein/PAS domain S-box-containing protein
MTIEPALTKQLELAADYEALIEFLYLTPVGIVKFRDDGKIELANPEAAKLLVPLASNFDMSNIYILFSHVVPTLRTQVKCFKGESGPVFDRTQFTVPGTRTLLTLDINKINAGTFMAVIRDVTSAIEQESRIRDDQKRFHAIFENIRDCAIFTVDVDGYIDGWNRSLSRLGGWGPADVIGTAIDIFLPQAKDGISPGAALLERASQHGTAEIEGWGARKNGTIFWGNTVATALPDREGHVNGFVLVTRDLTDRKLIEDKLIALATTDPLTGANNRRAGEDKLAEAFARWRRYERPFILLMIDCDHFKSINDRWGHDGGDAVLIALVRLCRESMRETDVTIRWGGEEFLLLLPETACGVALPVAERLRQAIEAVTVERGGQIIKMTVSIGVAEPAEGDSGPEDTVRRADGALYRAKTSGRNRVVLAR